MLRDISERVIVASKGRFDRARSVKQRAAEGLPHESTLMTEDFLALTLDIWSIPPESARRVGHPAPFPVELPEQLIRLYTYEGDLVLDPFMGSGSALVAAARLGRRYAGYDLDESYVEIARQRVGELRSADPTAMTVVGKSAHDIAREVLEVAGFRVVKTDQRIPKTGVTVDLVALDGADARWFFDVPGANTSHRGGMLRSDVVWKALGRASALRGQVADVPIVFLTTNLPRRPSEGDTALRAAGPSAFFDAIDLRSDEACERLSRYAKGGFVCDPQPGFWTPHDLA